MKFWSNSSIPKSISSFNPERRLLAAVLQRAITDYLTCDGELKETAETWLYGPDAETADTFGFSYVCEALDFHQEELRKAVRRQHDEMAKQPQAPRVAAA